MEKKGKRFAVFQEHGDDEEINLIKKKKPGSEKKKKAPLVPKWVYRVSLILLAAVLVLLSLHILRREPKDLRERSKNGEILLLTFEQIMALYNAAPEKWEMQVDSPTYYPHGKERDGLLVFMLPKERKRYRKWFDWRLSHGEDAGQFQMTAKALLSMQEDLAGHLQRLQQSNEKALRESLEAAQRILDKQQQEGGRGNRQA